MRAKDLAKELRDTLKQVGSEHKHSDLINSENDWEVIAAWCTCEDCDERPDAYTLVTMVETSANEAEFMHKTLHWEAIHRKISPHHDEQERAFRRMEKAIRDLAEGE